MVADLLTLLPCPICTDTSEDHHGYRMSGHVEDLHRRLRTVTTALWNQSKLLAKATTELEECKVNHRRWQRLARSVLNRKKGARR